MKALLHQALDALEATWPKRSSFISAEAQAVAWTKHEAAIKALRAAIAQGESEPVANLRRWLSGPELGAPERVIYAVKVLDAGRALPMGEYDLYLQPSAPQVADYVSLSDTTKRELVTNWFSEDWAITKAMQLLDDYDDSIERAVRGVK